MKPTFDRFIHIEFPKVNWDCFLNELKTLRDILKVLPITTTVTQVNPSSCSTRQNLHDIANDKPLNLVKK